MSTRPVIAAVLGLATVSAAALAREKWPAEPPEHKAATEAAKKRSDAQWQKVQPELAEWAKKGKPYLPGAAKPGDLPQARIPAFPGAEGGGMYSFGGRGGRVFVVTSLDDSGPGTLREACESAGPRVIVFNVAGIIHLKSVLDVRAPYVTIAGQTARGDGVCVAGASTWVNTHDVVIRYMRFRRGLTSVYDRDDALGGNPIGNVIVDHCSCSWGLDENVSMYRHMYQPPEGKELKLPTCNITIQWTISSEALNPTNHAFGGTWGGTNDVFHHNLFACNTGRNPSIGMGGDFNFVDNVLFDWRHRTVDGGDDTTRGNVINNYYKPGPVTPDAPIRYRIVKGDTNRGKNVEKHFGKFYVAGNVVAGDDAVTKDNWSGGVQAADVGGTGSEDAEPGTARAPVRATATALLPPAVAKEMHADQPFPMAHVTVQPAKDAYAAVLAGAGATLPHRDAVDTRVIDEVRSGKVTYQQGIITDVSQVGGYPKYDGSPDPSVGKDGIPASWKRKYHLDPDDPGVATKSLTGDGGYTVIECYLNGLDPTKKVDWTDLKNNVNTLTPTTFALATSPADGATPAADKQSASEAEYTKALEGRAADVLNHLHLNDPAKEARVRETVIARYRELRDWHDAHDPKIKALSKATSDDAKSQLAEIAATRQAGHDAYLKKLADDGLTAQQVDTVKDRMTYDVLHVTYNAYLDEVPALTAPQKARILAWLTEAREIAMDEGSSKEKHGVFGKYKGRINNYLAKEGYDMKKEENAWRERLKARRAAAATQNASK